MNKVKVNDDDPQVRENRLKLLNEIRAATRAMASVFRRYRIEHRRHPEVLAALAASLEGDCAGCLRPILRGSPKRLAPQDDGVGCAALVCRHRHCEEPLRRSNP